MTNSKEPTVSDDVVQRAKDALEGVTCGPWEYDAEGGAMVHDSDVIHPAIWLGDGDLGFLVENHYQDYENGQFVAAARQLVPELITEIERLRGQLKDRNEALIEAWNSGFNEASRHL